MENKLLRLAVPLMYHDEPPMKLLLLAAALFAGRQDPPNPPAPKEEPKPKLEIVAIVPAVREAKNGEPVRVAFTLRIPEQWHVYPAGKPPIFGKPTLFLLESGAEVRGAIEEPPPKLHQDPAVTYDYHEGTVTITVPIALQGTAPGPVEVKGTIKYQICDPKFCYDQKEPFSFKLTSLGGADAAPPSPDGDDPLKGGFLGLILLGMLGGLVSLIMPCTYPLIPITVTYFVKQAAGSRRHGILLSSTYALGIIVTFTGLGFLLSALLGASGARIFAANPWVNITVGTLFLWFTGSLFGWYEIQLPFGLGTKLGSSQHKGVAGAFILGLLFSVVTFTCTIVIAATIMSLAAGQHKTAAFFAMLAYSVTMAIPFFLLGFFPGLIKEIPRSGGWMKDVKVTMAWIELALAVSYFAKADQTWEFGAMSRTVVIGVWILSCLAAVAYLFRYFRAWPTLTRAGFSLVFLAFGGYMALGATGRPLGVLEILVPPPPIHGTTMPAAIQEATRLGRPLFVEFTGVT